MLLHPRKETSHLKILSPPPPLPSLTPFHPLHLYHRASSSYSPRLNYFQTPSSQDILHCNLDWRVLSLCPTLFPLYLATIARNLIGGRGWGGGGDVILSFKKGEKGGGFGLYKKRKWSNLSLRLVNDKQKDLKGVCGRLQ